MALDQEVKASIIAKYGRKDGDTGSTGAGWMPWH